MLPTPEQQITSAIESAVSSPDVAADSTRAELTAKYNALVSKAGATGLTPNEAKTFMVDVGTISSNQNLDAIATTVFSGLPKNANLSDFETQLNSDPTTKSRTEREKVALATRGKEKFATNFINTALKNPNNSFTDQIEGLLVDEPTKSFLREKSAKFIEGKITNLETRLKSGAITFAEAQSEVAGVTNNSLRDKLNDVLKKSPVSLQEQRKTVGNATGIIDTSGKVDLGVLGTEIAGTDAYLRKDLIEKNRIQGELEHAKKEREVISGNGLTGKNKVVGLEEVMRSRDQKRFDAEISDVKWKKFKENMKWIGKGAGMGLAVGLIGLSLYGGLGNLAGVEHILPILIGTGLGSAAIGGIAGGVASGAWNNEIAKLDVAQLDAQIKKIQGSRAIDELVYQSRVKDNKAIEEIFRLTNLQLATK